eukprot:CAMPEP_0184503042 /NCGR_PEP_ID=MMETSP0113_2-20130426/51651_1 /TAXON_ID=91329 /ORGANISM="Norrisiella sphaerica, Strain BC52" /LENGTH=176 /DNA_ID=CAMNT_0026892453 /DNA_START=408 /DNA_END=938 /DNA_ORIENTATION=-
MGCSCASNQTEDANDLGQQNQGTIASRPAMEPVKAYEKPLPAPRTAEELIRPGSGKALAKMWDTRAKEANQSSKRNIFSKHYDPSAPKLGRGQEGYGKAPAGSKSAERAERAKEWVKEQIGLLIATIIKIGTKDPEGNHEVTFGKLFVIYQDISDTLVGTLRRARKYGCVRFEGVH